MIVMEPGQYRLTQDWSSRGSRSIANFIKGMILNITQIDKTGHKIIGPLFEDWAPWDIPVERIEEKQ